MDGPTYKDAIMSLLSSCFPCRSAPALPPSPRLDALLRPPSTDIESDTDAMSLHPTYRPHARRKKKKMGMQLCGVNLFGKPRGAIRLEDDEEPPSVPRRYDSDAAPVPDSTIHSLSRSSAATSPTTEQPMRKPESPEEELARLRAEKAARKARRRDRRERKARRQLALEHTGEFEGYIGSGGDGFPISPPSTTTSTPGIEDTMDDEVDMGAAVYTHSNARSLGSSSSSGTGTSRTSASGRHASHAGNALASNALASNALGLQRGPLSPLAHSHLPTPDSPEAEPDSAPKPEPRPKIHIALPMSSPGAGPGPRTMENSPRLAQVPIGGSPKLPGLRPTGLGFPAPGLGKSNGFPSPGLGKSNGFPSPGLGLNGGNSSFPSPGLGTTGSRPGGGSSAGAGFPFGNGPPRKGSLTAGMGVALANRGD